MLRKRFKQTSDNVDLDINLIDQRTTCLLASHEVLNFDQSFELSRRLDVWSRELDLVLRIVLKQDSILLFSHKVTLLAANEYLDLVRKHLKHFILNKLFLQHQ